MGPLVMQVKVPMKAQGAMEVRAMVVQAMKARALQAVLEATVMRTAPAKRNHKTRRLRQSQPLMLEEAKSSILSPQR